MKKFVVISFLGYLAYLIFTTSCANPGMPTGGPKDSIPPVVVRTVPEFEAKGYRGKAVNLTFSEYIQSGDVSKSLVVSPPLRKPPVVKMKSKTLILDFGDNLKPGSTYSLDFRNSVKDNNEGNVLRDLRFAFSNGPELDTLTLGGYVRIAENMEPVLDALVVLHSLDTISAFRDSIPDYIAKTDSAGFYRFTNIAAGNYRLYALQDADNSLTYNSSEELIAFYDSLVVPTAPLQPDSLLSAHIDDAKSQLKEQVSLLTDKQLDEIEGAAKKLLQPKQDLIQPYYLLLFQEDVFDQYLQDSKRERQNYCRFFFQDALSDSFRIKLINAETTPEYALYEYSEQRDTVSLWIRDTVISNMDTLAFQLQYEVLDSLKNRVMKTDTVELNFERPKEVEKKRKKKGEDEGEEKKVPHFTFGSNAKEGFHVYSPLLITVPEPLETFDHSMVKLQHKVDTLYEDLTINIEKDSMNMRRYKIRYPWAFEEEYKLIIDSAAALSIGGYVSNPLSQKLKIKEEGYYGKIILNVTNLGGTAIIQLLKNSEKEELLQQISMAGDGEIEFPYLNPEKYKIRLVIDRNLNGKWDTGHLDAWSQPERVVYFPKILKLRSNFEVRENWDLPDDLQFKKELIDEDQLEKDKKRNVKKPRSSSM